MMDSNLKLLAARRSYEFHMDELRLSTLCLPQVREEIKQIFSFEVSVVGTPQQTFGPVPVTVPAGLVFNIGSWQIPDGRLIPIRLLHFEQRRIVVDVAGPSYAIDHIFERLMWFVRDLEAADGSPVIGELDRVLNYSEYDARQPFSLAQIFAPEVRDVFGKALGATSSDHRGFILPTFTMHLHPAGQEYPGLGSVADGQLLQYALRAGTRPEDGVFFSGAPLDSEDHREYLAQLEEVLSRERR